MTVSPVRAAALKSLPAVPAFFRRTEAPVLLEALPERIRTERVAPVFLRLLTAVAVIFAAGSAFFCFL